MPTANPASSIVFAALTPHPPIIVPEVGKGREEDSFHTVEAMKAVAERFVAARADVLVVISPHSPRRRASFGYWAGDRHRGDLAQFGASNASVDLPNDHTFVKHLNGVAEQLGIVLWPIKSGELDHGAMVPLYYFTRAGWRGQTVILSLNYPGEGQHIELGRALADAARRDGRRIAILASGDMSHRLKPGAPGGFHPEAAHFDESFVEELRSGNFRGITCIDPDLVDLAGEDVVDSTLIAVAAANWDASRRQVLSYEGPFGVGYCVAVLFDADAEAVEEPKMEISEGECLPEIAREALELYVRRGKTLRKDAPAGGYLAQRRGAFVTIRLSDGSLRGCIGVMGPMKRNLVDETIDRAIAVARHAYGGPVREEELDDLRYSVSVLSPLQPVQSEAELDPAKWGVLMRDSAGHQAVLLPGIASITTVEEQLTFVRRKGGIPPGEPVTLLKFTTDYFKGSGMHEED